jgi:putative spermidine/putrescine transport system permease protein
MRRGYRYIGGFLLWVWCGLVFAFLLGPLVVLLVTSFSAGETLSFPPTEYSTRWYNKVVRHLADDPQIRPGLAKSIFFSLWLGLVAAATSTAAGSMAAYALYRYRFGGMAVLRQAFLLPVMFPHLVIGVALLVWFTQVPDIGPIARLTLGHIIITLPYVILTVGASLETTGMDLEEAAIGLGASRSRAFLAVTLPLIQQGVAAGAIFAFVTSFNAFVVSYFLYSGEAMPLPMWMYGYMCYFVDPTLAAMSAFLIAFTFVPLIVLDYLVGVRRLAMR